MNYKATSQAILAILTELDSGVYEMDRHGKQRCTISKDLYERVKPSLEQASRYFEDLADRENT